jgi:hypothetical protein
VKFRFELGVKFRIKFRVKLELEFRGMFRHGVMPRVKLRVEVGRRG